MEKKKSQIQQVLDWKFRNYDKDKKNLYLHYSIRFIQYKPKPFRTLNASKCSIEMCSHVLNHIKLYFDNNLKLLDLWSCNWCIILGIGLYLIEMMSCIYKHASKYFNM